MPEGPLRQSPDGRPPHQDQALALILCGGFGFLAVLIGALGAHVLRGMIGEDRLPLFETAWLYHMSHALALGLLATPLALKMPAFRRRAIGIAFGAGILLFSGSLYARALGAPGFFAHTAPFGGLLLMAGWIGLMASGIRALQDPPP